MSTLPEQRRPLEAAPVAALERLMQWRARPVFGFFGILGGFLALALFSLRPLPSPITGLPDDPDVHRAAGLLAGRTRIAAEGLRIHATVLGGEVGGSTSSAPEFERLRAAERNLARARQRLGRDERITVTLAALELARRRYLHAEQRYRAAVNRTRNYGEAHLGLAMALAMRAQGTPHHLEARGLTLEAIAHCAAVHPDDPVYPAALYDRALLLDRVGRHREARRYALRYLAIDPSGEWARLLKSELGI